MMCRVSVAKQITQHIALGMVRKYQKTILIAIQSLNNFLIFLVFSFTIPPIKQKKRGFFT